MTVPLPDSPATMVFHSFCSVSLNRKRSAWRHDTLMEPVRLIACIKLKDLSIFNMFKKNVLLIFSLQIGLKLPYSQLPFRFSYRVGHKIVILIR